MKLIKLINPTFVRLTILGCCQTALPTNKKRGPGLTRLRGTSAFRETTFRHCSCRRWKSQGFRTHVSAVADVRIPKMKQQLKGDAKNAIKDGVNEGSGYREHEALRGSNTIKCSRTINPINAYSCGQANTNNPVALPPAAGFLYGVLRCAF